MIDIVYWPDIPIGFSFKDNTLTYRMSYEKKCVLLSGISNKRNDIIFHASNIWSVYNRSAHPEFSVLVREHLDAFKKKIN